MQQVYTFKSTNKKWRDNIIIGVEISISHVIVERLKIYIDTYRIAHCAYNLLRRHPYST